jgi:hypothetical protein
VTSLTDEISKWFPTVFFIAVEFTGAQAGPLSLVVVRRYAILWLQAHIVKADEVELLDLVIGW